MNAAKQIAIAAALAVAASVTATAQTKPAAAAPLELFGVKLKSAQRDQLRSVLTTSGMQPVRVDDSYWVDTYNAEAVLEGASGFSVGYVEKTKAFAYAEYEFRTFMDTGRVTKVANMVAVKYGRPSSQSGNEGLGPVTYQWKLSEGMSIRVARGWPDTTTYLTFSDPIAFAAMKAEQQANQKAIEVSKAKSQTKAF